MDEPTAVLTRTALARTARLAGGRGGSVVPWEKRPLRAAACPSGGTAMHRPPAARLLSACVLCTAALLTASACTPGQSGRAA
ncbi:hypothetical protein ABT317_47520, partial [Streptomyces carpinensis]